MKDNEKAITIRFPMELAEALKTKAAVNKRSLNNEVLYIVEAALYPIYPLRETGAEVKERLAS